MTKNTMRFFYGVLFLFQFAVGGLAQSLQPVLEDSFPQASFRGLSVVDERVVWASGSKGHIGRSVDGGKHWKWVNPRGMEKRDFRDIEAFDSLRAVAICVGAPALVIRTTDGGNTWNEVYRNNDTLMFLDGIDFLNAQCGIIFGDPIDGHLFVIRSLNGGQSWIEIPKNYTPQVVTGEAAFAASGTTIRSLPNGEIFLATGGTRSRLWHSTDMGWHWRAIETPIIQGEGATGIFSFALRDSMHIVIAGGDYTRDTLRTKNLFYTNDGGKTWHAPTQTTGGYRSCVEYISKKKLIATGTNGTDYSRDGGKTWTRISDTGFHVVRKAKKGNLVLLCGMKGKVMRLK
ncbi:MAG: WD40/YVTN/BNR-like repeat-containing protein [Bacteroidia bacterium]